MAHFVSLFYLSEYNQNPLQWLNYFPKARGQRSLFCPHLTALLHLKILAIVSCLWISAVLGGKHIWVCFYYYWFSFGPCHVNWSHREDSGPCFLALEITKKIPWTTVHLLLLRFGLFYYYSRPLAIKCGVMDDYLITVASYFTHWI